MKATLRSLAAAVLALGIVAAPVIPAAAAPAIAPDARPTQLAGVNDFVFESYSADFYLDRDAAGRSTLTTVETFVAVFPPNQNRGMRRAIPLDYGGVPTDVEVVSVTDGTGAPRPVEVETDDNGFLLVTSRADSFVEGRQTYVFTYTQHNVTRYFADTNDDELYWDTNGTGWAQPFGSVTARFHIPASLAGAMNGQNACYRGAEGSGNQCDLAIETEPEGTVITAQSEELFPYENVTVAIGFQPGTFTPRDDSYFASPWAWLQLLGVVGGLGALLWAIIARNTVLADGRGRPTIIAEYSPPEDLDPLSAGLLIKKTSKATAAAFVDLAVRRNIRIIEGESTGWFSGGKFYLLELIDGSTLEGPRADLAEVLFGSNLTPGAQHALTRGDTSLARSIQSIVAATNSGLTRRGYRKSGTAKHTVLPSLIAMGAEAATIAGGVGLLDAVVGGFWPVLLMVPSSLALFVVFGLISRIPLTEKGAERRDHLLGLELYIRLAEADRLRMLQSPEGAEREAVSATDPRTVIDVYEKLLPYAILFGLETQWSAELAKYYSDTPPDWYHGTNAFNAGVFAAGISSMSSAVASSYSGSSSSSSSGGSGGGGSSGGGGGGGGGGGV